jgi:hypothetical protein
MVLGSALGVSLACNIQVISNSPNNYSKIKRIRKLRDIFSHLHVPCFLPSQPAADGLRRTRKSRHATEVTIADSPNVGPTAGKPDKLRPSKLITFP